MGKTVIDSSLLWTLLGFPHGPPSLQHGEVVRSEQRAGHVVEEILLRTDSGALPGTLYRPDGKGPFPAVLYCHAHGNRYDIGRSELAAGRPSLQDPPYGRLLAMQGFAVACIDMPGFGDRQPEGAESPLAKAALWRGGTLLGSMIADLSALLDYLYERPDLDSGRVASFGISMGATHAYWLAALDRRIAATAHLCVLSDIAGLIETGQHDLHGIYLTVPGLLEHCDMGDVAGLVAPRPQLVGVGERDPLTPSPALRPALERLRAAYDAVGGADNLTVMISRDTGHCETPEMRSAVVSFLDSLQGI